MKAVEAKIVSSRTIKQGKVLVKGTGVKAIHDWLVVTFSVVVPFDGDKANIQTAIATDILDGAKPLVDINTQNVTHMLSESFAKELIEGQEVTYEAWTPITGTFNSEKTYSRMIFKESKKD